MRASCRSWLARATTSSNAACSASRVRQGRESHASATIQGDPSKRNPSCSTNVGRSRAAISLVCQRGPEVGIVLFEICIGGDGEEGGELLGHHQSIQDLSRFAETTAAGPAELVELLVKDLGIALARDRLAIFRGRAVVDPLPELSTGDFRGGGVLHQVVDRRGTGSLQPGIEILQGDADVGAEPGLGYLTTGNGEIGKLCRFDLGVFAHEFLLVR